MPNSTVVHALCPPPGLGGIPGHEDGYVVHSPSSATSPDSYASYFGDGSPNTARTRLSNMSAFASMGPSSPPSSSYSPGRGGGAGGYWQQGWHYGKPRRRGSGPLVSHSTNASVSRPEEPGRCWVIRCMPCKPAAAGSLDSRTAPSCLPCSLLPPSISLHHDPP